MTITPDSLLKNCNTEHCHQTALFCQAALHFVQYPELKLMFAVPNGESRGEDKDKARIVGGRLKAEGVKAGVCDIFLPVARGTFHGLFIEMKIKPNSPTPAQTEFIAGVTAQRYLAVVCYSYAEAWLTITHYLNLR